MIAEKVFAEGVAKDIRNYLPPEYEDADFQVVQKNKNNGIQLIGVQVSLPKEMQVRLFIWNNSLMKSDKGNLLSV